MRFLVACGLGVFLLVMWPTLYQVAYLLLWPATLVFWCWTQGYPDAARRLYDRLGL